ncbi:MAG: hypothetical protein ACOCRO_07530 [Halanaerobiales bacterium]
MIIIPNTNNWQLKKAEKTFTIYDKYGFRSVDGYEYRIYDGDEVICCLSCLKSQEEQYDKYADLILSISEKE